MDQNQNNQNNEQNSSQSFDQYTYQYDFTPPPPPPAPQSNGFAVASLILGIVSIILCCCCPPLPIITGILSIVFAVISRKGGRMNGPAIGGLICGILGILLAIATTLSAIIGFISDPEENRAYYEEFYGSMFPEEYYENNFEDGEVPPLNEDESY